MNLEGILEIDVPIVILAKLGSSVELSSTEQHLVLKWIKKLNKQQSQIKLKHLLRALKEISQISHLAGHSAFTFDHLIYRLDEMGCELFKKEDVHHMQWRENLKSGDTVICNGIALKLGEEMTCGKVVADQFRVFALAGDSYQNLAVRIARNTLRTKIEAEKAKLEQWHWGVCLVEICPNIGFEKKSISGLDEEGKCAVVEKLVLTLEENKWTSQFFSLDEKDKEKALVVANHIYYMIDQQAISENLNPSHLMFDAKRQLKAIRLLNKGEFNYNALEAFCVKIAKGNENILNFLMRVSQLSVHPVAKFYREAVEYTLKWGVTNLAVIELPPIFRKRQYRVWVEELCQKAASLRRDTYEAVRDHLRRAGKHHYQQDKELEMAVHARLLLFYQASSTFGLLCDAWIDKIVKDFLEENLIEPAALRPDIQKEYQETFELMKAYNRAAINL